MKNHLPKVESGFHVRFLTNKTNKHVHTFPEFDNEIDHSHHVSNYMRTIPSRNNTFFQIGQLFFVFQLFKFLFEQKTN